jgi:DNA polymerase-1
MRHHLFTDPYDSYDAALLLKSTAFMKQDVERYYVNPLETLGVPKDKVIAFTLAYNDQGKAPNGFVKDYLSELLPVLDELKVKFLYVADGTYFKVLAGQAKAEPHLGYALPCKVKGYEHLTVILGLNYQQLIYNPVLGAKLDMSLGTMASSVQGAYQAIGQNIIRHALYPEGPDAIAKALKDLHQYPRLACDIEAFSLRFNEAGIGTITFCPDQHTGVAFACDYKPVLIPTADGLYGNYVPNYTVRDLLREFFESYQGELIFHHAPYDTKAMISALWMKDLLDTDGMLRGLEVLTHKMHDTKIIAYLALNSTAGNQLSLKTLAHPFAGNWAVEVTDIRKVPLPKLLEYNLIDGLSTNYTFDTYMPLMEADNQGDLYRGLFLDSLKLIIQMELTGMPMSRKRIQEVKVELEAIRDKHLAVILSNGVILTLNTLLRHTAWEKDFEDRKDKAKNPDKIKAKEQEAFDSLEFNPNSGPQLQRLLYEVMGLPVIDYTDTKQPATGADTIEKLINHTEVPSYKELLAALIAYGKVTKILSTFIPAFEGAISKDGSDTVWLHGSFNLGGTVSGRLSSSDPNLQNIPAGSEYGKLIKSCFVAAFGWLFSGADFSSLEDYISALTTKDPNKLAVYERGFDGHCLRAAYYFRDQLAHIDLNDPKSVNTIKKEYEDLRQQSKAPTFLLTYGGTYHGMMSNLGWTKETSQKIEANYHELYKVSDEYVHTRLVQASKDGFVEVAFGLRVRTPLLKQVIFKGHKMPHEAAAEGRTAGNALGQSYGLLNNRAAVEFFKKVWRSPYRNDILPVALIHDAIYILIRNRIDIVEWANRELIIAMRWQELPEIQHPTVKLGAALDLFWPSWAVKTTLPNDASPEQIIEVCEETKKELKAETV